MVIPFGESGTAKCVAHADENVPKRYICQEQSTAAIGGFFISGELMSEIDVINERLRRGDERFAEVTDALSRITTHLQQQDAAMACLDTKIDKVIKGTEDVVSMWNGGVKAARFFCRLAEAWRFLIRQVAIPVVLPGVGFYALWYYAHYGRFPMWISDVYKLLVAML